MKKSALVVCPGRGTYNKTELGYLAKYAATQAALISQFDQSRADLNLTTVTQLDSQAHFSSRLHLQADNAAAVIFAAGMTDFNQINRDKFDLVALTGNSMGWYTALGCADVWHADTAMQIVTSMAQLTANEPGGQFIYPLVDDNWQFCTERQQLVNEQIAKHKGELFMSIYYGGYAVIAGTKSAVSAAMAALPPCDDRFPLLLRGHAGFHTPLMQNASNQALKQWPESYFRPPTLPLIDGRGQIWQTSVKNSQQLQQYTLQHQVCQSYNFTLALQVAVKEFAPEHIILLGPGSSLGSAVAQSLININWHGLGSKQDFVDAQAESMPYILSMGLAEQRYQVSC
jgi:[acyl-carrier-protein] S-malonyltransferase